MLALLYIIGTTYQLAHVGDDVVDDRLFRKQNQVHL